MTAEEVKRLQVGEAVYLCGDSGEIVACIVAGQGGKKFLTYRDKGQIKRFAIRDYPGRHYRKGGRA